MATFRPCSVKAGSTAAGTRCRNSLTRDALGSGRSRQAHEHGRRLRRGRTVLRFRSAITSVSADAAYTDYEYEDLLREHEGIILLADRRCNSKRPHPAHLRYLCQCYRKRIETTFSTLAQWLGRRLHAVTPQGWERKVFLTVLVYALLGLCFNRVGHNLGY